MSEEAKNLSWILSKVDQLPTLPQVSGKLLPLVDDPDTNAAQLKDVISRDPALASKILKLTNSAYYGMPGQVTDIQQAVVILGFKVLRSVILAASVFEAFKRDASTDTGFDRVLFWKHSIGTACIYRYLAIKLGEKDPEAAFAVGLLHDIGKLILDEYAVDEMRKIMEYAQARQCAFYDAERVVLATDHAQIGSWLLESWKLPASIVSGVRQHHGDGGGAGSRAFVIARFADYLCKVKGIPASGSHDEARLDRSTWESLNMKREDLPTLLREINKEIDAANEFLAAAVSS